VDRLRGEAERIGKLPADRERELERLLTAREVPATLPGVHPPTVEVTLPSPSVGRASWRVASLWWTGEPTREKKGLLRSAK
jgi:hypothetical protein